MGDCALHTFRSYSDGSPCPICERDALRAEVAGLRMDHEARRSDCEYYLALLGECRDELAGGGAGRRSMDLIARIDSKLLGDR